MMKNKTKNERFWLRFYIYVTTMLGGAFVFHAIWFFSEAKVTLALYFNYLAYDVTDAMAARGTHLVMWDALLENMVYWWKWFTYFGCLFDFLSLKPLIIWKKKGYEEFINYFKL